MQRVHCLAHGVMFGGKHKMISGWFTPSNFDILENRLPNDLFLQLKQECIEAEKTRYNDGSLVEMASGLSGTGTAKHYLIKNNENLKKHVLGLSELYIQQNTDFVKKHKTNCHKTQSIALDPWINVQERGEYIPSHDHDGVLSYSIWMTIPYNIEEELTNSKFASTFQFSYLSIVGDQLHHTIAVDKSMEGTLIMFPANLKHCVYPFYTTENRRISISGNIALDALKETI